MKTSKILATIALTGVLGTTAFAGMNGQNNDKNGCQNQKKSHKMMMQKKMKKGQNGPLSLLRQINLTDDQKDKIRKIREDIRKNRVTPDVAFTKDGFDKAKFIEIMKQKRENMIESQAEMIDRVYKVLTPKQKEQLKVLMDLKKERMDKKPMGKRINFDKNCNGRG